MRQVSFSAILVTVPLVMISYLTFRASMGRVEDANEHVAHVNKLYLSTIETLAIAIDAKDEVTHGHVRRVQLYAIGLARALGLSDAASLKALEAAALLHDAGKLAVPDSILNKPGRLTPAEFEKIKLHVKVGAEILGAIDFPYPVVPIVRHHHENWDGTGYPDGVSGIDIPIGARILAVVDCFDALTSDRPYRRRLSERQALAILIERRGTMYDPLVVDTFIEVHSAITPPALDAPVHHHALVEISRSAAQSLAISEAQRVETELRESTEELVTLCSLARSVSRQTNFEDAAGLISAHLESVVPCCFCAFYALDPSGDELVLIHAAGTGALRLKGRRVTAGHGLSGWVAANRQTILNSDPALDLGGMADVAEMRLRSALSTPLLSGDIVVGVLTFYSRTRDAFTEHDGRVAQMIAPHASQMLRVALALDRTVTH
jgi:putative nucleotidyltransferase with HDIG domain